MEVTLAPLWNMCPSVPIGNWQPLWGFKYSAFDQRNLIQERRKSKLLNRTFFTQKGTQHNSSNSGFSRTSFIILILAFLLGGWNIFYLSNNKIQPLASLTQPWLRSSRLESLASKWPELCTTCPRPHIHIFPGWSGAEIKCAVSAQTANKLSRFNVDQQSQK